MAIYRSKLTPQSRISVPAEIRKKLGIGPGSILEWEEEGEKVVVRRLGRFSSEDIHRALFPGQTPKSRTLDEMKAGSGREFGISMRAIDSNVLAG
jgi:AbrB family looped-hinge helix DNA binding protein